MLAEVIFFVFLFGFLLFVLRKSVITGLPKIPD